jgi:hypothetical protein
LNSGDRGNTVSKRKSRPKYPQSISLGKLFPWLSGLSEDKSQRLHHAMKRYALSPEADPAPLAIHLERSGIYSNAFTYQQKPIRPDRYNGHRGGKYPGDGK